MPIKFSLFKISHWVLNVFFIVDIKAYFHVIKLVHAFEVLSCMSIFSDTNYTQRIPMCIGIHNEI